MTKRQGYVSPARAANILGVHRNTVYGWAMDAIAGETSKFKAVERHPLTGYLEIPLAEVESVKKQGGDSGDT
jgi:hypothetical protein